MNSRNVIFRLTPAEWEQLRARAESEGDTVSELIRDALYARYGIGSLTVGSSMTQPATYPGCNAPRT